MKKLLSVVGLSVALFAAAGCNDEITARDVHSNMSPELSTMARTKGEVDTQISRTVDTNGREAWEDVLNALLLDRPTRLSTYPVP